MSANIFRIVFMGTPDFAVPSLRALQAAGHDIALVLSQPDRPKGRGRKSVAPPVKRATLDMGLAICQSDTPCEEEMAQRLRDLRPDLLVVIAFGHILSRRVLEIPSVGAINLHASLLPRYRGPAPIQWAIINGETETGVTSMFMDPGMDTGDILKTVAVAMDPRETAATLHDRLALHGAKLLVETLDELKRGRLQPMAQDHSKATYAPMLKKTDGHIQWQRTAEQIDARIRGLTPWPGAYCFHEDRRLKVIEARPAAVGPSTAAPGTLIDDPDGCRLLVACGQGVLEVVQIQGASGKRLCADAFLCGNPLPAGSRLS